MKDIIDILKEASPVLIVVVILAYFLKGFIEKRLEGLSSRVDKIAVHSLEMKKDLREEERGTLVEFRVAVEKWEYSLFNLLYDFTMIPASKAEVTPLFEKDKELFLNVKIAIVKASIYLRNEDLELQLMESVEKIRNTYYPLINTSLPKLIDIQAKLMPLDIKLNHFEQSGMTDISFAPTEQDRQEHLKLQMQMTEEIRIFSESFLKEYKNISEQMYDLKEAINQYIYRSIGHTAIHKD